jgi:hypothetical protein
MSKKITVEIYSEIASKLRPTRGFMKSGSINLNNSPLIIYFTSCIIITYEIAFCLTPSIINHCPNSNCHKSATGKKIGGEQ